MNVIVSSEHDCFREYIKRLLSSMSDNSINVVLPESDDCINAVVKNKDAVIILDAYSEKPYSECSVVLLDKLWKQGLNNPVLILGWQTKECMKEYIEKRLRSDINRYFGVFYEASYQYLQLSVTTVSLLSRIQDVKPLNHKIV